MASDIAAKNVKIDLTRLVILYILKQVQKRVQRTQSITF